VKKVLTGSGRADKDQVQRAVQREFGLTAAMEPPDVSDALAVALCHFYITERSAQMNVMRGQSRATDSSEHS
jgi:crossover junction endodeoxyribonuclease RuvC